MSVFKKISTKDNATKIARITGAVVAGQIAGKSVPKGYHAAVAAAGGLVLASQGHITEGAAFFSSALFCNPETANSEEKGFRKLSEIARGIPGRAKTATGGVFNSVGLSSVSDRFGLRGVDADVEIMDAYGNDLAGTSIYRLNAADPYDAVTLPPMALTVPMMAGIGSFPSNDIFNS